MFSKNFQILITFLGCGSSYISKAFWTLSNMGAFHQSQQNMVNVTTGKRY